jgi:UDP-N-acetylmuramoyl-tripeptide--D-alanyl-D-alanine ligase
VGPAAADYARGWGKGAEVFDDLDALAATLSPQLEVGVTVLVKGSRSARMEALVAAWSGTDATETH